MVKSCYCMQAKIKHAHSFYLGLYILWALYRMNSTNFKISIFGLPFVAPLIPFKTVGKRLHTFDGVGKCLFHPVAMWSAVVCFLFVAGWMMQSWQEILYDVAAWSISLRGDRLLLLSVLLLAIKGLHELGHALACRWAGAECREIGIMFFFGIPCLYCDVSDAWKIPDRWKRMLISAAGIYIELLLAMAASIVWLNSTEPAVRAVSLQVVLFCTRPPS